MPRFDRLERGFDPAEGEMSSEVEQSLKMLCGRLDALTSSELSARQIELYYPGAVWMKEHPANFPQYTDKMDFIDSIIDTHETAGAQA